MEKSNHKSRPLRAGLAITAIIGAGLLAAPTASAQQDWCKSKYGPADGMGHIGVHNVYYNCNKNNEFVQANGLTKLGIEKLPGFGTRGVVRTGQGPGLGVHVRSRRLANDGRGAGDHQSAGHSLSGLRRFHARLTAGGAREAC